VHPLGLVKKAAVWYMVAGTENGQRTFRLNRVRSVELTEDAIDRPEGFDLEAAWSSITAEIDERRAGFRARASAEPEAVPWLRSAFGSRLTVGEAGEDGRVEVELRSWSPHAIAGELASFGRWVEVIEPAEARAELARIGAELTERYGAAEAKA
jgi:predicted DNA-binding transcriptional regulator YafY